ncbi:MAG: hypothetical protein F6K23_29875 [Okeania sp. SIO2C9]|uniref:hypothetical protein n=1 Tax=Okeania sp. SIO2C9 TaxID=2607791 RepID=UPI0013C2009D|nr:hypothetical protein [Okeania sp. SIO2C9]NEQ76863.1 hypothetical protein [Okeania sp. SIO2C9]
MNIDFLTQALVSLLKMSEENNIIKIKLDSKKNQDTTNSLDTKDRIKQIWQRLNKEAHYLFQKSIDKNSNSMPDIKEDTIYQLLDELPGLCSSLKAERQEEIQKKISR